MRANLLPALAVGAICLIVFRYYYLRCSMAVARVALILVALALATPAALFASNYVLLLPYADWFVDLHALAGAEITSGLVGGLLGIMLASARLRPGPLNRPILAVCSILAAGLLVTPFAKQLYGSVDYSSLKDTWKDGICLQSSEHTCVPACVATMIRLQGGHLTEPELARSAGATVRGTEFWYLRRALRERGYEPQLHRVRSLREAPVPSIVGVTVTGIGHVVVLLKTDAKGVTIGEPLRGRRKYSWSVFQKCYRPDHLCITVRRL